MLKQDVSGSVKDSVSKLLIRKRATEDNSYCPAVASEWIHKHQEYIEKEGRKDRREKLLHVLSFTVLRGWKSSTMYLKCTVYSYKLQLAI